MELFSSLKSNSAGHVPHIPGDTDIPDSPDPFPGMSRRGRNLAPSQGNSAALYNRGIIQSRPSADRYKKSGLQEAQSLSMADSGDIAHRTLLLLTLLGVAACALTWGVISGFRGSLPHALSLELGESVHILEKCDGWYRGSSFKNPGIKGIFPANIIHLKKAAVSNRGLHSCDVTPYGEGGEICCLLIRHQIVDSIAGNNQIVPDLFTAPPKTS